jgi:hypothetical protein
MASRNNTTPIGDGQVGIDPNVQGAAAQEINKAISENNLKWQLGQNTKVKGVYNAAVQMLSRWTDADKIRIIQQFGSVEGMPRNPSSDDLSQRAAMTLISSMNQDDLKRLIGAEEVKSAQLAREVAATNARTLTQAQRAFNIGNIQSKYAEVGKKMADPGQMMKMLKKTGFTIDKIWSKGAIPQLDKDIKEVLANFTPIELAQEAALLGIEFEDGSSKNELIRLILNKVDMYASLILGKQKGVFALGMDEAQIAEVERLISFSPKYAWIAGKVVAGATEIQSKRKAAQAAKRKTDAMKKNAQSQDKGVKIKTMKTGKRSGKKGSIKSVKFKGFGKYRKDQMLSAASGDASAAKNAEQIRKQLNLDGLTEDEIRALGAQVGVRNYETDDIESIKQAILAKAIAEASDIAKDRKKASGVKNEKKRKKLIDAVGDRSANSITAAIAATKSQSNAKQISNEMSDQTPVVSFNESGEVISEAITKAVPVYIMGSADHAGRQLSHEDAERMRGESAAMASGANNIRNLLDIIDAESDKNGVRAVDPASMRRISDQSVAKPFAENRINALLSQPPAHGFGVAGPSGQESPGQSTLRDKLAGAAKGALGKTTRAMSAVLGSTGKNIKFKDFNDERKEANNRSWISLIAAKDLLNADAMNLLNTEIETGSGTRQLGIAKADVMPVFNIGGYKPILDAFDVVNTSLGTIITDLSALPIYIAGLQQGGTAFNAASAGASAGYAVSLASDLANAASAQFATGGSMRAKNPSVSHIITGDSPRNKNNTELVSVDWKSRSMNVQPIPKMATGGVVNAKQQADNSGISSVHRLSTGDRNKPLEVGIAAGLVSYDSSISGDFTDDGTNTAVKVYSVNGGIQTKIKVGDSEMSLFDAVYGIYSSLPQISEAIAGNTQILSSIATSAAKTASNTSAIASGSGAQSSSGFEFTSSLDSILAGE